MLIRQKLIFRLVSAEFNDRKISNSPDQLIAVAANTELADRPLGGSRGAGVGAAGEERAVDRRTSTAPDVCLCVCGCDLTVLT